MKWTVTNTLALQKGKKCFGYVTASIVITIWLCMYLCGYFFNFYGSNIRNIDFLSSRIEYKSRYSLEKEISKFKHEYLWDILMAKLLLLGVYYFWHWPLCCQGIIEYSMKFCIIKPTEKILRQHDYNLR